MSSFFVLCCVCRGGGWKVGKERRWGRFYEGEGGLGGNDIFG